MNIEKIFGEELQKIRKEKESDGVPLSSGRYEFGAGVYCDLRATADGGLTIDRLFVSEKLRGSGLHKKMLSALVWLSDEIGVELFMAVAPDRLEGEAIDSPRYNKVTDLLVSSAEQLGFQPYRDGEDVYRLDQIYTPKSRPIVCGRVGENAKKFQPAWKLDNPAYILCFQALEKPPKRDQ